MEKTLMLDQVPVPAEENNQGTYLRYVLAKDT